MRTQARLALQLSTLALIGLGAAAQAQVDSASCGPVKARWDYRTATPVERNEVEGAHFPPIVEHLIRGNRGYLGGDLSYTLRASPNHHRALVSAMRYAERSKTPKPRDMQYPIECYFDRAIRFAADDHIVRLLYAQFLIGEKRNEDAARQLEQAATLVPDNGFTLYNIGLLYADMKNYPQALAYAHKSMAAGMEKPELRQRLEAAGQWQEPAAPAPAASAASGVKE
jgi:tetratricopeptide (TPR) repeat protein